MTRLLAAVRDEVRLLRTDFWMSKHSGALLILAFGVPWFVLMLVLT